MPSMVHEALLDLFRSRPTLAVELLRDALGLEVPAHSATRIEEASLTQASPAELRADLVLVLADEAPVFGIVVEVQLGRDPDKAFVWPLYAAALRARIRAPTCVLVITPNESVARWARQPIATGQPASGFQPVVVGPEEVPRIATVDQARAAPELAVLSARVHGRTEHGAEVFLAMIPALAELAGRDAERAKLYLDIVWSALGAAARRLVEKEMETRKYEYQSDFARKYVAEGEAKGRAEGRAEALLTILSSRGIEVADDLRTRILACADLATLDRWLARAATAESADEVLDEDAPR
jgi:hypothetical protein